MRNDGAMIDLVTQLLGAALLLGGAVFFLAGTVGLLRFPDVYSRLHAPAKADNVGLGLVVAGLALWHGWSPVSAKLLLVWLLVLPGSGLGAYLIARDARRRGAPASSDGRSRAGPEQLR